MIEQKKIQLIQKITSKKIVRKIRDIETKQISRKNILLTARCHSKEVIVLKINNEKSRKTLRNDED